MDESIQKELEKKANDEAEMLTKREPEHWVWYWDVDTPCHRCNHQYPNPKAVCIEDHTYFAGELKGQRVRGGPVKMDKKL